MVCDWRFYGGRGQLLREDNYYCSANVKNMKDGEQREYDYEKHVVRVSRYKNGEDEGWVEKPWPDFSAVAGKWTSTNPQHAKPREFEISDKGEIVVTGPEGSADVGSKYFVHRHGDKKLFVIPSFHFANQLSVLKPHKKGMTIEVYSFKEFPKGKTICEYEATRL